MTILAVDDEKIALEELTTAIAEVAAGAEVLGFRSASEALTAAQSCGCDVAFLDIQMRELNGVELAKRFKRQSPATNIIFVTGYSEYMGDALSMHASGYLLKPVTPDKIRRELEDLRHPLPMQGGGRVRVQTFGNFEVFVENHPLKFRYDRTKELLAYLVDRAGALATTAELMGILFEDEPGHDAYFKSLRKDLLDTLAAVGCKAMVVRQWGKLGVDTTRFRCDYYDFCAGRAQAINAYRGEYMAQYSWAEFSKNRLETR